MPPRPEVVGAWAQEFAIRGRGIVESMSKYRGWMRTVLKSIHLEARTEPPLAA